MNPVKILPVIFLLILIACSPLQPVENNEPDIAVESPEDIAGSSGGEPMINEENIEKMPELSMDAIRNASLPSPLEDGEMVTLVNGRYEGKTFVEGASSQPVITLLEPVAFGDLDQDGMEDAAAITVANASGSGSFYRLEIFHNLKGMPEYIASYDLGDRVKIRGIGIRNGMVFVKAVVHAEGDSMSQPTLLTLASYAIVDGKIELANHQALESIAGKNSEVALSEIAGTPWRWIAYLDNGETGSFGVEFPANYTLQIGEDGSYLLLADCNQVQGKYKSEGPSQIQFLPGATTLMACGEESRDADYLQKLNDVRTFVLADGQLHLNLMMDAGNMVFEPMMQVLDSSDMAASK